MLTDKVSKQAAVIDPVLDFDPNAGKLTSSSADHIITFLDDNNLQLQWILETHAHADHITAAHYLKNKRGGQIGISEQIKKVQSTFSKIFNLSDEVPCDGSQFDHLFKDNEMISLGELKIQVMHTPGHTPACVSYKIEDAVFVGDTLLMPDFGTARTDFPDGSAELLYQSIQRILSLPDTTRIFVGHDYKTSTRDHYAWETSVLQQKQDNIHMKNEAPEQAFVDLRTTRDAKLPVPRLLLPAIQINIQAGRLPEPEENGTRYLKVPLNVAF